mmetsp:Transcript_24577/g.70664  ORF Transcript_24577/g.70664 Transcript_24577/m.70664 type:complete len:208 (+) Transcript_24577:269-892(+)
MVVLQEKIPATLHRTALRRRLPQLCGVVHVPRWINLYRQLRALAGLAQHEPRVGARGAGQSAGPRGRCVLRAGLADWDRRVIIALGQAVVEHAQDRREHLVPEGAPPPGPLSRPPVAGRRALHCHPGHGGYLVRRHGAEDPLPAGHQEPNGAGLRMRPGHSLKAVHVAPERGATSNHLIPVLIKTVEKDQGHVNGNSTISCQKCIHE